jgi:MFS family permease
VAFLTGYIASHYGIRPYPFYVGILLVLLGLLFSIFFIRDTSHHVELEAMEHPVPRLRRLFWDTTLFDRNLGSVTQAGLINNLNDGMARGLLPILLSNKGFGIAAIGTITAIYPAVWGIAQLFTGKLSDRFCKKSMLYWGMFSQGIALILLVLASTCFHYVLLSALLGMGTALVYPTFLATVAENTHPPDRAASLGVFRLWRDLGYSIGALLTSLIADRFGINASIVVIGMLTLLSAIVIDLRIRCRTEAPALLIGCFEEERKHAEKLRRTNTLRRTRWPG